MYAGGQAVGASPRATVVQPDWGVYSPADSGRRTPTTLVGCKNPYRSEVLVAVYTDRTIACFDCGQEFTFTAGEQEFYAQRGFTETPKRCPSCRQIRKAQRARSTSLKTAEGGNGSGSWSATAPGDYGNGFDGGSAGYAGEYRERRPRVLFEAVCADCGKTASVPFRPTGAKPVYCSDCFQSRR